MLGLDTVQLVLVLIGACFIVAGLFGLFPVLNDSRLAGVAGAGDQTVKETPSKSGPRADLKAIPALLKMAKAEEPVTVAGPQPSLPATPAVLAASAAPQQEVRATAPAAVKAPAKVAVPSAQAAPEPATQTSSAQIDDGVVEELFAELFALRSSVTGLTREVRDLRAEQRSRRFILREVTTQPAGQEQGRVKTSA